MRIVGLKSKISCVRDIDDTTRPHNRADPYTESNSCFSGSSDSLNSLNSMKVPLHLEKTPIRLILNFK